MLHHLLKYALFTFPMCVSIPMVNIILNINVKGSNLELILFTKYRFEGLKLFILFL